MKKDITFYELVEMKKLTYSNNNVWELWVENETNCQFMIKVQRLSDSWTYRISVVDMTETELFETKSVSKIKDFIELVS